MNAHTPEQNAKIQASVLAFHRKKRLPEVLGKKVCIKCLLPKDEGRFEARRNTCKDCRAAAVRARPKNHPVRQKQRMQKKYAREQGWTLKYLYGLSMEQWDEMMLNQGGMCAICDRESKLCVDHDHGTKKVRALLCRKCNAAIGLLQDSVVVVKKAYEYLERFS